MPHRIPTGSPQLLRRINSAAVLRVPRCHPLLSPMLAVVPLQLLAYHIAGIKGLNVDPPRNLAKTVTVE